MNKQQGSRKTGPEKKILFVMQVPPPVTGATLRNQSVFDVLSGVDRFATKLISIRFAGDVSELSSFSVKKIVKSSILFFRVIRELIFFRPDIVYLTPVPTGFAYWRDLITISLVKIFRKKMVLHLRPLGYQERSQRSGIIRRLNRFIFRNTRVICLSSLTAKDVEGIYPGSPMILPNGIETVDPGDENPVNEAPVILFFSNLFAAKGLYDFLDALRLLRDRGLVFRGRVCGEEGDISRDELEAAIVKRGLNGVVTYIGKTAGNKKYGVLRAADMLVFLTHRENFPGVVLEAMQAGLPVVSVREGSIPEIVIDGVTGILNDKGDVRAAADSIEQLISDPLRMKRMGEAGRERFLTNYTMDIFRKNIIRIIDSV